jgi:hypothetical protein
VQLTPPTIDLARYTTSRASTSPSSSKNAPPLWIAEQLTATAIDDAAFRQAIPPNALTTDTFAARIEHTRTMLIEHLSAMDLDAFVGVLRRNADTEQDLDLI